MSSTIASYGRSRARHESVETVMGQLDVEPLRIQALLDELGQADLVFDHEHAHCGIVRLGLPIRHPGR